MENKYQMVAKTFQGLEDVLRDELISLGAENVETGTRMVAFEGDLELMYKANLCCRTALRILKPIAKFSASDPDELYDFVRDFKWEDYMGPKSTFCVDSTVNGPGFPHSKYVTYRVKDGIADHFRDLCGERPSIRLEKADLMLNVHIADTRVTISLDSSGEPLSRRGYRVEQTEAPINEVLAAGIIMLTGWHGESDFADPMCGSGTFPIEAALIAGNINPGIYRESFAFEKWPDFDSDLFESLYNDDSAERDITCSILCGDIDPEAVQIARKNIRTARLEQNISIVCRPMQEWDENDRPGGIIVTNPPYGERLRPADMENLYRQLGETLKFHFQGWNAWILGYKDEHFASIGLKPSLKYPILNGALECSLREYVLFEGKYNEFRAEGGSVRDFERDAIRDSARNNKTRHHKSEREWERETRPYKKKFERTGRRDEDDFEPKYKPDFKDKASKGKNGKPKPDFKTKSKPDFKRRDKADFKTKDRGDFKPKARYDFKTKSKPMPDEKAAPYRVADRGPRLSAESTALSNPVYMRSRKQRRGAENTEEASTD